MTFVVADRVQENGTVSVGTGSVTLTGAVNGYQTFASGIGNNNTTYYTIYDPVNNAWEVGLGTVTTSPNTLARTTVYANSSGTQPSKISFPTTDTLSVFVTYPAEIAIYTGASSSLNSLTLTSSITGSSNKGALNYGTLSYSDTNIFESYQTSVNSYAQLIVQNSNAGSAASADIVVSSDSGTASANYGNFGINSTGYTGTGPLNAPSMVYLYSQSYDLTIGTNTSNAIHFTINNAATDAMTINTSGSIAINGQTGSLGQVLISQGSSNPPSWGNAGGNLVVTDFTATAGQTTFTVTYVVGTVSVYRNGIKLGLADFTATNGTSVVLATGAAVGDLIEIQSFSTLTLYSSITVQDFSGNGSTTAFTLNTNPANSASLLVAINGVVQDPANYTVVGNTLTFSTAPATGTNNISCRTLGVPATTAVSSFSAGTTGFSPTTAASGAVTLSGILNVANGGTGLNTLTSGYIPYGNGTGAFNSSSTFNFNGTTLFVPNESNAGNLTFTGTGAKILGDFSNATLANRTVIQTSTTNAATGVYVVPNGTSTAASIQALNAATPTNAAKILIATNGTTDVQLVSGINGSASYLPLTFYNSGVEMMRISTAGLVSLSNGVGFANQSLSSAPSSPVVGQQYFNSTTGFMQYWTGTQWAVYGNISATSVSFLVVAGGGGGGYYHATSANNSSGGGGGAGGLIYNATQTVTPGTSYTVTVGGGGAGSSSNGTNGTSGSNSLFGTFANGATGAVGGGGGGANSNAGLSGGSGGGGGAENGNQPGGSGTSGQGNAGGSGVSGAPNYGAGGGGGAGAAGTNGNSGASTGGGGGNGLQYSISGTPTYYAGGGGGGYYNSSSPFLNTGGLGGGGNGAVINTNAAGTGATNTGGGGGGGGSNSSYAISQNGAAGGSGVVIIAYPTSFKTATTTGSCTYTVAGGNNVYTFTGSGTITF